MSNDQVKFAKTTLANKGEPDHTSISFGRDRVSWNHDKGKNVRDVHMRENGAVGGDRVNLEPKDVKPYQP